MIDRIVALDLVHDPRLTLSVVKPVEDLGYDRFWITEHDPQPSPEILVGLLAGVTGAIRIGTAGILLLERDPVQAAQDFLFLESLFPGRIDAGFCRGIRLRSTTKRDDSVYQAAVSEFVRGLRGEHTEELHQLDARVPETWIFGTSSGGAVLAAEYGIAFGYSLFHHFSQDDTSSVERYRAEFRPSGSLSAPRVGLAVAGVIADTTEKAQELRAEHTNEFISPTVVGEADSCARQLHELCDRYQPDELIWLDVCWQHEDKLRSYELFRDICRG